MVLQRELRRDGEQFDSAAEVMEFPHFAALVGGNAETGITFFLAQREFFAVGSNDISSPGVLIEAQNFCAFGHVEEQSPGIRSLTFGR